MSSYGLVMGVVVLLIIAIVLAPIISIWALNTLFVGVVFKTAIELTLWTYLAMMWISGIIGATATTLAKN